MDRINGANYATVGGLRMWQDRNQTTGVQGTFGNALFFNGVQEELMSIISAAGIAPNATVWNQVLTGLEFLFGGGGGIAASGWQRLAGGLIVQWGVGTFAVASPAASVETEAVVFPTPFPSACFAVTGSVNGHANSTLGGWAAFSAGLITTAGFTAVADLLQGGTSNNNTFNVPVPFNYLALGN